MVYFGNAPSILNNEINRFYIKFVDFTLSVGRVPMNLNIEHTELLKDLKGWWMSKLLGRFKRKETEKTGTAWQADEARELLENIHSAKKEWECATMNFEYVSDEQVVDYYTYKIKACELRYAYLIRKAKEMGIRVKIPQLTEGTTE